MHKYHIKPTIAKLLSLSTTIKYTLEQIKITYNEKNVTINDIISRYPRFKGCKCVSTHCKINVDRFFEYIVNNEIFDDGLPECSFYFGFNETPTKIDSFIVV